MNLQPIRRTLMFVSMLLLLASFVISIGLVTNPISAESSRAEDSRPTPLPRTPVPITPCPTTPIPTLPPTPTPTSPPPTLPLSTPTTSEATPIPTATPMTILLPATGKQAFLPLEVLRLALTARGVAPAGPFWQELLAFVKSIPELDLTGAALDLPELLLATAHCAPRLAILADGPTFAPMAAAAWRSLPTRAATSPARRSR